MTAADVLRECAVAGFEVRLREDGSPVIAAGGGGRPNAALLAALREHRAGIVATLGGTPAPDTCGECRALVRPENGREAIGLLCDRRGCPYGRRRS